jgi:uncharacterized protein (TIGR02594 family)
MLPQQYLWLLKEGAPKMIVQALSLYGTIEGPGNKNNPLILSWAKELGVDDYYTEDEIPWCGLFMGVVAKRAGKQLPHELLRALSWAQFGTASDKPMLGDVLVFKREGGGHVTLYVGEDDTAFHCLGGNQSDSVCITRIAKARLFACRRPVYASGQPANVRSIYLTASGIISTNEA